MHAAWFLRYWKNCALHDTGFVWPSIDPEFMLAHVVEANDILGNFIRKFKHKILI